MVLPSVRAHMISEKYTEEVISLPMHSELTREQVEYISNNFIDILS